MALIVSTDIENVKVQAFGNWFEFKPGQVKLMDKNLADFLCERKRDLGFVVIDDRFEDDRASDEFKAAVAEATVQGRKNIIQGLNRLKYNIETALQRDLAMNNIKADPLDMLDDTARQSALNMYRKLKTFKDADSDGSSAQNDEIRKLKEAVNS